MKIIAKKFGSVGYVPYLCIVQLNERAEESGEYTPLRPYPNHQKKVENKFGGIKIVSYICTMETMREKLIDAIFDMAADEIENVSDAKKYAAMSDEQLVDEVINLAEYYRRQANEN